MKRNELPWLDWMRFTAAFAVLGVHARAFTFLPYAKLPAQQQNIGSIAFFGLTRIGEEAVLLFFVLSGFLVGGKLIERVRTGKFDLLSYATDRATRIWVPLIPAVFLSALVIAPRHLSSTLVSAVGTLVGLQGSLVQGLASNGPFWTLAYEIWFYVLGGAIATLVCIPRFKYPAFATAVFAFIVLSALQPHYVFCWALGAIAYEWRPTKNKTPFWILSLILIGMGAYQIEFGRHGIEYIASSMGSATADVLFSSGCAVLLSLLATSYSPTRGFAVTMYSVGRPLAAFSYTLYLTHYPILVLIDRVYPERDAISIYSVMLWFGKLSVCMVMALCIYFLFERNTGAIRALIHKSLSFRTGIHINRTKL